MGRVLPKGCALQQTPEGFHFHGRSFKVFKSRVLPEVATIQDGTHFSRDRRRNWFLNVCIGAPDPLLRSMDGGGDVGIDPGLKDFATLWHTTGAARCGRNAKQAHATVRRANLRRCVQAIHARTANLRSEFPRQLAIRLVREFDLINKVGDGNA